MFAIKTSIALTLLRFLTSFIWRVALYFIISIQGAMTIVSVFFLTLQCRPIRKAWDITMDQGSCLSPSGVRIASVTTAGINIATDLLLSLIPLAFLVNLRRPLRERLLIMVLMAMGIAASVASIRKTTIVLKYGDPSEEPMDLNVSIPTWTLAEQFIGVTAACMPSLKNPIQKLLAKIGFEVDSKQGWSLGSIRIRTANGEEEGRVGKLETGPDFITATTGSGDRHGEKKPAKPSVVSASESDEGSVEGRMAGHVGQKQVPIATV